MKKENNKKGSNKMEKLFLAQTFYAERFTHVSDGFEEQGLYKKMADFIGPEKGIIIDAGCGDCKLIKHIYELNGSSDDETIIGIDINPVLLLIGYTDLTNLGYDVNFHHGVNLALDPDTKRHSLISDLVIKDIPFKFKKGINLLQEDFRFGEILRENYLGNVDTIVYTLSGGFSPHIMLEQGEDNYNSVRAGIDMNRYVMAMGEELLKPNGRMIWGLRATSKNMKLLNNMNLKDLDLSFFDKYFTIKRLEVIHLDELDNKTNGKLSLPAFAFDEKSSAIHYTKDITKLDCNFETAVVLMEMIKN